MTIVTDLPKENLPLSIQEFITDSPEAEQALWAWVSDLHYAQVVAQAGRAHELVAIKDRFDWTAIERVCQAYRLYDGKQGVAATPRVETPV